MHVETLLSQPESDNFHFARFDKKTISALFRMLSALIETPIANRMFSSELIRVTVLFFNDRSCENNR